MKFDAVLSVVFLIAAFHGDVAASPRSSGDGDTTGLSPCHPDGAQAVSMLPAALSAQYRAVVLVTPAFRGPTALGIADGEVARFDLEWVPAASNNMHGHFKTTVRASARIPRGLSDRVVALLTREVDHAAASPVLGLDGTNYYVDIPDHGCATTWSPGEKSRAGGVVELISALSALADTEGSAASVAATKAQLNALER
ncbi:hypothetical protein [Lysobacter sp. HA18]